MLTQNSIKLKKNLKKKISTLIAKLRIPKLAILYKSWRRTFLQDVSSIPSKCALLSSEVT